LTQFCIFVTLSAQSEAVSRCPDSVPRFHGGGARSHGLRAGAQRGRRVRADGRRLLHARRRRRLERHHAADGDRRAEQRHACCQERMVLGIDSGEIIYLVDIHLKPL
jgi:hypothetical protein